MIYRHSVTMYNRKYELIATISDQVKLSDFDIENKEGVYRGGPVEAAFSPDGSYAWVSNYRMSGNGYYRPAMDTCKTGASCERSFLYKIDVASRTIIAVAEVGCVPKFLAITPDASKIIVSNWCSGMISILDANTGTLIREVKVGSYPRGIAIDSSSTKAYIALMGSTSIMQVDLASYSVAVLQNIGNAPRHICISPDNQHLYISLNGAHKVIRYHIPSAKITGSLATGSHPRSMILSKDGRRLYVANYKSNTITKINTDSFNVMESIATPTYPIGITFDDVTREIWVAGYTGTITIYKDKEPVPQEKTWKDLWIAFTTPIEQEEKEKEKEKEEGNYVISNVENSGMYCVVIASYANVTNAQAHLTKLRAKGYEADIQESGELYRVAIGEKNRKGAEKLLHQLRRELDSSAWLLLLTE